MARNNNGGRRGLNTPSVSGREYYRRNTTRGQRAANAATRVGMTAFGGLIGAASSNDRGVGIVQGARREARDANRFFSPERQGRRMQGRAAAERLRSQGPRRRGPRR